IFSHLQNESKTFKRLVVGGIVAAATFVCSGIFWLSLPSWMERGEAWIAILVPLVFCDTWKWMQANRNERITLWPAFMCGLFGYILSGVCGSDPMLAIGVLAGTALAVQVVSPWDPTFAGRGMGSGKPVGPIKPGMKIYGNITVDSKEAEAMRVAGAQVYGNMHVRDADANAPTAAAGSPYMRPLAQSYTAQTIGYMTVPRGLPYFWLGGFIIMLTVGFMCIMGVATDAIRGNSDQAVFMGVGVAACLNAVFCFIKSFKKRFIGWWSYLVRPTLMLLCVDAILISIITMANMNSLRSDDEMIGAFFIYFPAVLFIVMAFLPRTLGPTQPKPLAGTPSPHDPNLTLGLASMWFLGFGGIHRFYVGKIGTGILWLMTGGGFFIGQIIDLILICTGQFTDSEGRVIRGLGSRNSAPSPAAFMPPPVPNTAAPAPAEAPTPAPSPLPSADSGAPAINAPSPTPSTTFGDRWAGVWDERVDRYRNRARRAPRVSGGLASLFATVFTIGAIVAILAVGLDFATAIDNHLPNASIAQEIHGNFFAGYDRWTDLMHQLLFGLAILLGILAAGFTMLARRNTTLPHVLRGLIGVVGLFKAATALTNQFNAQAVWSSVAQSVNHRQTGAAIQTLIDSLKTGQLRMSIIFWIVSCLILSIPYRRRAVAERGV
ncbi:MAG TPA: TM2 domain-containing protein, partial [Tepidisphaeraceae bacterium]|nr:TM2 domain-containing protein [Tepidisphaeraceae bacterium]